MNKKSKQGGINGKDAGSRSNGTDRRNRVGSSNHRRLEHFIKHNLFVQQLYRHGMSMLFRLVGLFLKTDKTLVLMNGHGYQYNDSPRSIYRKMLALGLTEQYQVVWALNEPEKADIPGCKKIRMDTLRYFLTALRAGYWISCVNIERGLHFKKKNQVYLNTWHGAAINVCGNGVSGRRDFQWGYINYFCVCGKYDEVNFGRDFALNPASFLRTGLPRNDTLYQLTPEIRARVRKSLGLREGKRYLLYAPTWRESNDGGSSYQIAPPVNWKRWKAELGEQYVVLLRTHPYTTRLMNVVFDDFVRDFTDYPEVNDLLIAADILISDYSSIILDYCILGKPILCFGYDYDAYQKSRGFYYDLETEMPNGVMRSEEEIIAHLKGLDYAADCEKTVRFRERHCEYGNGNAALQCINAVFGTRFTEDSERLPEQKPPE